MKDNNLEKMPAPDIIKALEDKTLNRQEIPKGKLKECVRYLKEREHSSSEIGKALQMSSRNALRYVKKIRKENVPAVSIDFQKEFIWEVINNFRMQYARLIKISYSEEITHYERIRAIFAACQALRDATSIAERFGFLSKEKLEEEEKKHGGSSDDLGDDPLIVIADKLIPQQREKLVEFLKTDPGYTEEKLLKMAKLFVVENKKLGLYGADGNLQTNGPAN